MPRNKPNTKPNAPKPKPEPPKGSVLHAGGRRLRMPEDLIGANEQIFDAIEHNRCSPKQMEQLNQVVKQQSKLILEFPLRLLQLVRDMSKVNNDRVTEASKKLIDGSPALKKLIAGE